MADWTTCRVVRDRDERLWMRYGTRSWESEDPGEPVRNAAGLGRYAPITPVLDADGLPVVTTVGDLTARHLGKRVQVECHWDSEIVIGQVLHLEQDADGKPRTDITDQRYDDDQTDPWITFLSDTPCEVLP